MWGLPAGNPGYSGKLEAEAVKSGAPEAVKLGEPETGTVQSEKLAAESVKAKALKALSNCYKVTRSEMDF